MASRTPNVIFGLQTGTPEVILRPVGWQPDGLLRPLPEPHPMGTGQPRTASQRSFLLRSYLLNENEATILQFRAKCGEKG